MACGKQSTFQRIDADRFGLEAVVEAATSGPPPPWLISSNTKNHSRSFGPIAVNDFDLDNDELALFRNVHYSETRDAIGSIHGAEKILADNPKDSRALRYLGSWYLCYDQHSDGTSKAIEALEIATAFGTCMIVFHNILLTFQKK